MTRQPTKSDLADKLSGMWSDISPVCTVSDRIEGTFELRWRGHLLATLSEILGHCIFSVIRGIVETPGMDPCPEPADLTVDGGAAFGEFCGKVSVMESMVRMWPEQRLESAVCIDLCVGAGTYGQVEILMNEIRFKKLKSETRWEYAGLKTMCRYTESITGQIERIDQRKLEKEVNSLRTL